MKHLHILFEHSDDQLPHGCSMVRLLRPLGYPGVNDSWRVTQGTDLPSGAAPDLVIVERLWKPGTDVMRAQELVNTLRGLGCPYIYTLDDDLLGLDLPPQRANAVRLFARHARGVIVSTPPLAERMRRLNPNVVTVPNQIDDTLFGPPREPRTAGDVVTMGYMGTLTHLPDLLGILEPLRRVLRRQQGRLRMELVGVSENPRILDLFQGLPVTLKRADGHVAYDRFVPWMKRELQWDFAVAPLCASPFNACKSDLKYLDYAALSIPGIFSDVTPYRETVNHDATGLLAGSSRDWEAHITAMATDPGLRRRLAVAARDHVYAERCLKHRVQDWVHAIGLCLEAGDTRQAA